MSRGRGRPTVLGEEARRVLLVALEGGATVAEAAAAAGVHRDTVYAARARDGLFDEAVTLAAKQGRAVRRDARHAHGSEYRYVHMGCRCGLCRAGASAARRDRRAEQNAPPAGRVVEMSDRAGQQAPPLDQAA